MSSIKTYFQCDGDICQPQIKLSSKGIKLRQDGYIRSRDSDEIVAV